MAARWYIAIMLTTLRLAIKFLWREVRAGEWTIVFLSLMLAITATTTIYFYTDRLSRGLYQRSTEFFGADLVVFSATPIPEEWSLKAKALGLRTAEVWSYSTVVSANNKLQLV